MTKETHTFSAVTADLLALNAWLEEQAMTPVAMESTGVSWYPVHSLLEQDRTILLVNSQHINAIPGRETDVKDSEWLADLLRHGLLTAIFVPPQPMWELRKLTRYRNSLVQAHTQEVNRLQNVLESANIKLAAVATDITDIRISFTCDAWERNPLDESTCTVCDSRTFCPDYQVTYAEKNNELQPRLPGVKPKS